MPYLLVLERASGTHIYSVQQELSLLTSTCSVVCLLPQAYSNKLRLAALEVPGFIFLWCLGAQRKGMVISMKMQKSNIAYNLTTLRQLNKFSQEEVAERIGVSRQAVAKWEAGQSVPDILNCDALAKLYDVELDDLIHYDQGQTGESIPPKGKHIFGTVRVGERGQIVLPKQARDVFKIKPGDMLVVLGDEEPEHPGIALMKEDFFLGIAQLFKTALNMADTQDGKEKK